MSGTPKRGTVTLVANMLAAVEKLEFENRWSQLEQRCVSVEQDTITAQETAERSCLESSSPEAKKRFEKAMKDWEKAKESFAEAKRHHNSAMRGSRLNQRASSKALSAANVSIDQFVNATIAFHEARSFVKQEQEEKERRRALLLASANLALQTARREARQTGELIEKWSTDERQINEAANLLKKAENELNKGEFEKSQADAKKAAELYRVLEEKASENLAHVERRDQIVGAIVSALRELSYDEPAVRYQPVNGTPSEKNVCLSDLTIRADTAGGKGNMLFHVDLNGNLRLEVDTNEESDCRNRVQELSKRLGDVVDLKINDWGDTSGRKKDRQVTDVKVVTREVVREKIRLSEKR